MERVLVTGSSGFLGSHIKKITQEKTSNKDYIFVNSSDYDLLDLAKVKDMLNEVKPDKIIHLAAYSGGIGANKKYPADFFFINIQLLANLFEAASKSDVKKIIYPMGGCSYPAKASSPIDESQLWNGYPQEESAGYSTAKMMGIVASRSYKTQYGLDSTVLIPGNMYGEYDNFSLENSHVIPAVIRKIHSAKENNQNKLSFWGTGNPTRDFVYAGDVAKVILEFLDLECSGPVNISTGTETKIKELVELVKKLFSYTGDIEWDTTKPDGQMNKIFSVKKLKELNLQCSTELGEGLNKTISWYLDELSKPKPGIRL